MMLALAMLYPFVVLLLGVLAWDYLSPINLIGTYPHRVVAGTGLAFGFLVGRMILSHICDEPKDLKTNMCMSLLYLPLAIANTLTARLNDGRSLLALCNISHPRNHNRIGDQLFQDHKERSMRQGETFGFFFWVSL